MDKQFKEGYFDGYGQAIENVRYNLLLKVNQNGTLTAEEINSICDHCSKIDEDTIDQ